MIAEHQLEPTENEIVSGLDELIGQAYQRIQNQEGSIERLSNEKELLEGRLHQKELELVYRQAELDLKAHKIKSFEHEQNSTTKAKDIAFEAVSKNLKRSKTIIADLSATLYQEREDRKRLEVTSEMEVIKSTTLKNELDFERALSSTNTKISEYYRNINDKIADSRDTIVTQLEKLYSEFSSVIDDMERENKKSSVENKISADRADYMNELIKCSKSIFLEKIGLYEKSMHKLAESQVNSYSTIIELSKQSFIKENENKQLKRKIEELEKGKVATNSSDVEGGQPLFQKIFGDIPKELIGGSSNGLEALYNKVEQLDKYLSSLKNDIKASTIERDRLKQKTEQMNNSLREMYSLDCDIGFDQAKELHKKHKRLVKSNEELQKQLSQIKIEDKTSSLQMQAIKTLLSKRTSENSVLLFLNSKLKEQLLEYVPDINLAKFTPYYFRKCRVIGLTDNDASLVSSYEDLFNIEERLTIKNLRLEEELKSRNREISNLADINKQLRSELSQKIESLEKYEMKSVMDITGKKNLKKIEGFIEGINKSVVLSEVDKLKEELTKKSRREAELKSNNIQLEAQLELSRRLGDALRDKYHKLTQIKLNSSGTTQLLKETPTLLDKQLRSENGLLRERILSFKAALTTISDYFKDKKSNDSSIRTSIETIAQIFSDRLFDIREVQGNTEMIEGLELENESLKSQVSALTRLNIAEVEGYKLRNEVLSSFNNNLEYKCRNLILMLRDFSHRVEQLEKERENLEANSILERLKDYLLDQSRSIDSLHAKYHDELQAHEKSRESYQQQMGSLEIELNKMREGKVEEFNLIKEEFEKRFESIVDQIENRIKDTCNQRIEAVKIKEDELNKLEEELNNCSFDGKESMMNRIKALIEENKALKAEMLSLTAKADMRLIGLVTVSDDIANKAINSTNELFEGEIIKFEGERILLEESINKLRAKINELESSIRTKNIDFDKVLESLAEKEIAYKAQIEALEAELLNKSQKLDSMLTASSEPAPQQELEVAEEVPQIEAIEELKNQIDLLQKEKEADKETVNLILIDWEEALKLEETPRLTRLEELRQRLSEWMKGPEEIEMTQEEMMDLA